MGSPASISTPPAPVSAPGYIASLPPRRSTCLRSWLYRVVTTKAIDLIRKHARCLGVAWEALVLDQPALASWKDEPAAALEKLWHETLRQVLLERLRREVPEDTFRAFSMRYLEKSSVAETAAALSLTVDQVKYRCRCAIQKLKSLRQLYEGEAFDDLVEEHLDRD
jgi:RNA polymerase sigma factor (sigma-70 family)